MPFDGFDWKLFIRRINALPFATAAESSPWELTACAEAIVRNVLNNLSPNDFEIVGDVAIHRSAVVEAGAILKGPLVLGAGCFVASGAYLRGGNWLERDCSLGPGVELKSSFLFAGVKLAHFNFVGDSIIGEQVNMEAGSIVCNYRNERQGGEVRVRWKGGLQGLGHRKFGALIGDHGRVGANAVIAPGALLRPDQVVQRASLIDQESE